MIRSSGAAAVLAQFPALCHLLISRLVRNLLIRTKFYRPALPGDFVERPHLLDQLNRGLDRPLTLVSAPAGFGKSILVSSWLNTCARPSAWLALDESVDDLGLFLPYFLTAMQTIAPAALQRTQALLTGFSLPAIEVLAGSLINELDEIEHDFVIVLEDYHTVHAQAIHELLAALLRHPLPHMHLVLISRQDPPLPLSVCGRATWWPRCASRICVSPPLRPQLSCRMCSAFPCLTQRLLG